MHKHALVTGASSGIGEAVAKLLASKNIQLTLVGRNSQRLEEVANAARELGAPYVETVIADLSLPEGIQEVKESLLRDAPDLVINNAGVGVYGESIDIDLELQQKLIDINVSSLFQLTWTAAKALINAGKEGVILNVSSVASVPPFPGFAVYSASKAFVSQFSISLDYELQDRGIRVLTSCPGVVITRFRENAGGKETDAKTPGAMTPEYAAEQIWWQINKRKPIHYFSWRYRMLVFLTRYLLPRALVAGMLYQSISSLQEDL